MQVMKTDIPARSLARSFLPADYADCFTCRVRGGAEFSPDDVMVGFWTVMPRWVEMLMRLRDLLVRPFGLATGGAAAYVEDFSRCIREGASYEIASVPAKSSDETVLCLEDKHLTAWLSIRIDGLEQGRDVHAITLVRFHNLLGKSYFALIRPFHGMIVRSTLASTVTRLMTERG